MMKATAPAAISKRPAQGQRAVNTPQRAINPASIKQDYNTLFYTTALSPSARP
ncbi:MAG: hypothetical protein KA132_02855 [Thauera sp.]|uniref:hypothetical protein n=1 Tax=Thauera terpenica TaxID=76113 RepID=UPI0012FB23F5|nr:hypothetical protein [Thauera terpenica]MBP6726142.1 hypothetical protein [Thauera sp.]MBP6760867.1 hypothetical protein [Thauera sp.]